MVNYRRLYYQAVLIAWGRIPMPQASMRQYESAIEDTLVAVSKGYETDPEIPDNIRAILLPALLARGVKRPELVKASLSLNAVSTGKATSGIVKESLRSVENESVVDNLMDITGALLNLDLAEAGGEFFDLVNDLFSGGGLIGP